MRVAIIHSQQPANQYTGGGVGVPDSEQAWMRKLSPSSSSPSCVLLAWT